MIQKQFRQHGRQVAPTPPILQSANNAIMISWIGFSNFDVCFDDATLLNFPGGPSIGRATGKI